MIRSLRAFCLLLVCCSLFACKTGEDAIAAAQQMTATAAALNGYYAALAVSVTQTVELNELDASLSQIPFSPESRAIILDTRTEILKRKNLAEQLAQLASAMAALAGATPGTGASAAATSLANELVTIKALPGGSPIPAAIGKAASFLLQLVQEHKEREAARAMDETIAAIETLFEVEKPTYDSIARVHLFLAAQVAKDIIDRKAVDPAPMLAPALRPFNLAPLPLTPEMQTSLRALSLTRLKESAEQATQREATASAAMLAALHEMTARVHTVATEKPMLSRGNPFSLNEVESWITSIL